MQKHLRQCIAVAMAGLLVSATLEKLPPGPPSVAYAGDETVSLSESLKKSYLDLFEFAKEPQYRTAEINSIRDGLKRGLELCVSGFKQKSSEYGKQIDQAQKELKKKQITESQRHELHCKIQNLRAQQSEAGVLAKHAIPIAYENRKAKLDLIEQWPAKYKEISKQLEDGTYRDRRW